MAEAPPSRARGNATQKENAATFSEQIQGAVALGRFQNPTECAYIRRLPCGQLLRAAVAEERASPSASIGDQDWPRAVRRPHALALLPQYRRAHHAEVA